MKKAITFALVLVLALSLLTACGEKDNGGSTDGNNTTPPASQGGNNTTPSGNGGNSGVNIKDTSIDNWQAVVKDYFGIDISLPSGWSVDSAQSLNGISDVTVKFKGNLDELASFAEAVFDLTKAVTTDGIQSATGSTVYTSFSETEDYSNSYSWKWFHGSNKARVQVIVEKTYDGLISLSIDGVTK
ncbi:MAG: hypothetical protein LBN02_03795 [Oscillospiraceae bacterium]|jgi:hypothetical protein|nr:hypothetical protein [Oscillospiraceae bacterium]